MKEAINRKRDDKAGWRRVASDVDEAKPGPGLVPASEEIDLHRGWTGGLWWRCSWLVGVALSLNVADPDLWGHVQYGRDALAKDCR